MIMSKLRCWPALFIFSAMSILTIISLLNTLFGTLPLWLCFTLGVANGVLFSRFYPIKKKEESDSACVNWNDTESNG